MTVVLISLCLLLGRTWQLQVLQGESFLRLSEQNRLRSLRTKSLRGKILDRHGYVLVDNRAAYTLMAIPADLPPRDELAPLLRTLNIDIDPETLRPRRRAAALKPVPIQRDFPRDQVAYFAEHRMDFPGMFIEVEPLRTYPYSALASQPAFDPNAFVPRPSPATWRALSTDPHFPLHNRATQGQYPPGSVFKIVTALAALADGVITPSTTVCCPGYYYYGEHTFRDWRSSGHGCVQLRQALTQSCDIYFYHVGQLLGVDRIASHSRRRPI